MSARERPPVRPSANGSGPDPADGSKGDATVADSTQVDTPDTEAAGAVDVPVLDHNGSAAAGEEREIVATTDDRENGGSPDGQPVADHPDGQAEVDEPGADEPGADEPGAEQAEDQADTRQAEHQVDAGQPDDDASVAEAERDPSTDDTTVPDVEAPAEPSESAAESEVETVVELLASDDAEPAADAEPAPASVATVESAETVEQPEDKTPDPIEVANRFAAEAPEPASLFVRPDKAPASSAVVPEQVPMEMPVLAPVDEATMPEMASMVPEPDLHLRPAFQQHQYDTVSAFRRDRSVGAGVPIPSSWPDAQPAADPGAAPPREGGAHTL